MASHITPPGEKIVQGKTDPNLPAWDPITFVEGEDEVNGPYQVRREFEEGGALPERLADEPEVPVLEVTEPTVNQPAGA
jgi:hypothetical protein